MKNVESKSKKMENKMDVLPFRYILSVFLSIPLSIWKHSFQMRLKAIMFVWSTSRRPTKTRIIIIDSNKFCRYLHSIQNDFNARDHFVIFKAKEWKDEKSRIIN